MWLVLYAVVGLADCAQDPGYGYDGNDLKQQTSKSADDCCELCNKEPQCFFFSWSKSANVCYMKSSDANRKANTDQFSGHSKWTLLNDTDWSHTDCQDPNPPGKSAEDCANQCFKRQDCVATSFNGPESGSKDGRCNFKCNALAKVFLKGEIGVVVRPGQNLCSRGPPTPAPTPAILCPDGMPEGWRARCLQGHLFYSPTISGGLIPEVGNGYIASKPQSDTIFAAGEN